MSMRRHIGLTIIPPWGVKNKYIWNEKDAKSHLTWIKKPPCSALGTTRKDTAILPNVWVLETTPFVIHVKDSLEAALTTWLAHMFGNFDQSKDKGQVELNHPDTNSREIAI